MVSKFVKSLTMFSIVVSSKIHESFPPPISNDGFSYYLHDIQAYTLFEFSPIQIYEIESTNLPFLTNKSLPSTYPN